MGETQEVLASWRLWQEAQALSERTIKERAAVVTHLLAYTGADPLTLTPADIIRFTARRDISATSRGTYHASIRAYCAWLVRTEQRTDDPSKKTPTPKRPKGVPRPVPSSSLASLLGTVNRRRTRMMILLAAMGGLRVHEIAKFHGGDLDRLNGVITVTGKGGKTAMIPAHDAILAEANVFPKNDYWFPAYGQGSHGRPHVTGGSVSSAIADTMARAGIVGKPHQLRHWYGTTLLASGVDLRIVQMMMRHESPATTALYTEVDMGQQAAGMRLLQLPVSA
jgi:integrase/recombinase XerD